MKQFWVTLLALGSWEVQPGRSLSHRTRLNRSTARRPPSTIVTWKNIQVGHWWQKRWWTFVQLCKCPYGEDYKKVSKLVNDFNWERERRSIFVASSQCQWLNFNKCSHRDGEGGACHHPTVVLQEFPDCQVEQVKLTWWPINMMSPILMMILMMMIMHMIITFPWDSSPPPRPPQPPWFHWQHRSTALKADGQSHLLALLVL